MFDKILFQINALKVIPGETQDDLLTRREILVASKPLFLGLI